MVFNKLQSGRWTENVVTVHEAASRSKDEREHDYLNLCLLKQVN